MKRFLTMVIALCFVAGSAYAALPPLSAPVFSKGDLVGGLSIGVGHGFSQKIALEYGVADGWLDGRASLGVGGSLNNCIYWYGGDALSLVAHCAFHYQFIDDLDTYVIAGIGGGIFILPYREEADSDGSAVKKASVGGGVDWISAVGVRYYFQPNLAVNGELGYTGGSYLMVGVSYKF